MSAGFRSLAVHFPSRVVDNAHWLRRHPRMVEEAETSALAKVWTNAEGEALLFDRKMAPYLSDPFRGAKERRWLKDGETSLSLEIVAAACALEAALLEAKDVDLLLVSSFFPDQIDVGNAAFLARELGVAGAAWNVESACTSALVSFQTACALIDAGQFRRVLVVSSCSYSRLAPETDSLSWANGDGACAFVVEEVDRGAGFLGGKIVNTSATCGAITSTVQIEEGRPVIRMRADKGASKLLRETAEPLLRTCVEGALSRAGVRIGDIAFFAFNAPTAWYADFCATALGIDKARTVNTHPLFANTGPVLTLTNLFYGAHRRKVRRGDLVLAYGVGNTSNATAVVVRWGDVGLGPLPAGGASDEIELASG